MLERSKNTMELSRRSSEKIPFIFVEKNMRSLNEKHIQTHVGMGQN